MSAATADSADAAAPASPKKTGKKKLIIILAAVLVLAGVGGGATVFLMKKKAAAAAAAAAEEGEEGEEGAEATAAPAEEKKKRDKGYKPTFVPLEPFVVNLADKEAERYAQIGVTLEVEDPHTAESIKTYMPAIRNGVLMVLSRKTSAELLSREGKVELANEIMLAAAEPLGFEPAAAEDHGKKKKKKAEKEAHGEENPISHVHFSNFIVQ
jgi:flagellar FliL protein